MTLPTTALLPVVGYLHGIPLTHFISHSYSSLTQHQQSLLAPLSNFPPSPGLPTLTRCVLNKSLRHLKKQMHFLTFRVHGNDDRLTVSSNLTSLPPCHPSQSLRKKKCCNKAQNKNNTVTPSTHKTCTKSPPQSIYHNPTLTFTSPT